MTTFTQSKRYRAAVSEPNKGRQLSSLFNIISNNLLIATEALSNDYKIKAVHELESLSRKARILAKELMSSSSEISKEDLTGKISTLKSRMLELVADLTDELSKVDSNKSSSQKAIEDIILARRLLRESQRGLITIQD